MPPKYSIVIPTYNHLEDCLKPCLTSIIKNSDLSTLEVIVVANGCTDGTRQYIEDLGHPFRVVWFDEAIGYTKATNAGIIAATGEYIVLLNNDNVILDFQSKNDWLRILEDPFVHDSKVAITGVAKNYHAGTKKDFLLFFCAMIKASLIPSLGLLDEIFGPGYGEDIDYCHRARRMGYSIVQVPNDINIEAIRSNDQHQINFPIWHKGSKTVHEVPQWDSIVARNERILSTRYPDGIESPPKYSIIIPTYQHLDDCLRPCCESIKQYTNLDEVEVIVVANGCTDGTKEYVEGLGKPFKLIFVPEQLGFTKATNIGMRAALGRYIVLLNNDATLLPQSKNTWLEMLALPFETSFNVGMSGPMLFNGIPGSSNDFIMFFCAMTTRDVIDKIGYLDEIYSPGGVEDVDYGLRLILDGYSLVQVPVNQHVDRDPRLSHGAFPIYHPGGTTCAKEKDWDKILVRNNEILKKKFPHHFKGLDWIEDIKLAKPKIYDCFPFFNELEILQIRFAELYDIVEKFIIVESPLTHSGKPKSLYLTENISMFERYRDKIVIHVAHFSPDYNDSWQRERHQRDAAFDLLGSVIEQSDDSYVIISDCDEIPRSQAVLEHIAKNTTEIGVLIQDRFMYFLNNKNVTTDEPHLNAKIVSTRAFKAGRYTPCGIRYANMTGEFPCYNIPNGGWHFTFMGGAKKVVEKIKAFAHQEYNTDKNNVEEITRRMADGSDIYNCKSTWTVVDIDESFPEYIRKNKPYYVDAGWLAEKPITHLHEKMKKLDEGVYGEIYGINVYCITDADIKGRTVIDIGAHYGFFAVRCAEAGAKVIHSFEPNKDNFKIMSDVTAGFDCIRRHNVAVLDGSVNEICMADHGCCARVIPDNGTTRTVSMSMEDIMLYFDSNDLLLKMDCEGSEFEILFNTSDAALRKFEYILIEIHDRLNPNYMGRMADLIDRIQSLGFTLVEKGPQPGMWMPDGKFVPGPACNCKFKRAA